MEKSLRLPTSACNAHNNAIVATASIASSLSPCSTKSNIRLHPCRGLVYEVVVLFEDLRLFLAAILLQSKDDTVLLCSMLEYSTISSASEARNGCRNDERLTAALRSSKALTTALTLLGHGTWRRNWTRIYSFMIECQNSMCTSLRKLL